MRGPVSTLLRHMTRQLIKLLLGTLILSSCITVEVPSPTTTTAAETTTTTATLSDVEAVGIQFAALFCALAEGGAPLAELMDDIINDLARTAAVEKTWSSAQANEAFDIMVDGMVAACPDYALRATTLLDGP